MHVCLCVCVCMHAYFLVCVCVCVYVIVHECVINRQIGKCTYVCLLFQTDKEDIHGCMKDVAMPSRPTSDNPVSVQTSSVHHPPVSIQVRTDSEGFSCSC